MNRIVEIDLKNWDEIHWLANKLDGFIFRGQANACWELKTSIERCFEKYKPVLPMYENKEHWILHEFKEKFHLYSQHPPAESNNFEWLALLQHHGCPTRLLDFSESIYIAAYFAVSESTSDASIWVINTHSLKKQIYKELKLSYDEKNSLKDEINKHHVDLINQYISNQKNEDKPFFVIPLSSTKRSIRLSSQQGLFLAPLNMGDFEAKSYFMKNLAFSFGLSELTDFNKINLSELSIKKAFNFLSESIDIMKINIPQNIHSDTIRSLKRMNISEETLFPGLDGLAKSLILKEIRR